VDFKEIGQSLLKVAPILGTALGGPAGGLAGALLAAKFGGDATKPEELLKRINSDPERDAKLAEIEADKEIQWKTLLVNAENNRLVNETAQLKIQADDKASARAMNMANKKWTDELSKLFEIFFVAFLIFYCLKALIDKTITGEEIPILTLILGAAISEWKNQNGFFWGSSIGSKEKDILIAQNKNAK